MNNQSTDQGTLGQIKESSVTKDNGKGVSLSLEDFKPESQKRKDVNLEDALNETGFGKYNYILILVCGLLLFAANSEGYGIGFIVPAAVCELELNSYKKGILTSTSLSGMTISCAIWGYLSDIKGRRCLLLLNLITAFFTGLIASVTSSFWGFCVLRFINGICISGPTAITFVYFGEFLCTKTKAKSLAWATNFVSLSMIYLPTLGWFLLQQVYDVNFLGLHLNNWRIFMLANSVPSAVAAVGLMTLPESPRYLYHTGKQADAMMVLKKMYSRNSGKEEDAFPVETLHDKTFLEKSSSKERDIWNYLSDQIFPLFKPPLLLYTLSACFMQAGAFSMGSGLFSWYPDIIMQISNSGKTSVTICEALSFNGTITEDPTLCDNFVNDRVFILNIIIGLGYLVAYATWFVVVNALGTRNVFIACMGISAIGTAVLCFLSNKILIDILFVTALVLPGISITIINVWVVDIYPTHICGMALCTIMTVGRLGGVVSSSIVGMMLEWSCLTTFLLYALNLIALEEVKTLEVVTTETPKKRNVDFEEALEETGFGKYNVILIFVCGLLLFAANSDAYGIGFTVPAAECELELNSYKKGILTSTSLSGMTISCAIWGYLSDVRGRRNLLLLNLVTAFLTGVSAAVIPSFWGFCILRFLNGICISGPTAMTFVYFGEFLPSSTRAKCMAVVTVFLALVMIYLPSMGWFLLQQEFNVEFFGLRLNNWRTYMLANTVPNAIAALGLMSLPESPKFLYHTGNPKEAMTVLKKMYSSNTGKSEDSFPVESLCSKVILEKSSSSSSGKRSVRSYLSDQILPLFKPPLLAYTVTACFIQAVNFSISTGLFSWYPDIITRISNSGLTGVTVCDALSFNSTTEEDTVVCNNVVNDRVFMLSLIIGVYYLVAYTTWGVLIKIIGTRNFFMSCMGISALGMVAVCFLPQKILIDIFFITALTLTGISVSTTNAWVIEIFPTYICGMAICTILTAGRLGGVASSSVVGIMLDWDCLATFMLYALSLLVSLVLSLLLPQKK